MLGEQVSSLIRSIYTAANEPGEWTSVLQQIGQMTGSRLVMVATLDTRQHLLARTDYAGALDTQLARGIAEYEQHVYRDDPTFAAIKANPALTFFDIRQYLGPDGHASHPYVKWSIAALGTSDWLARSSPIREGFAFAASIHSAADDGPHCADARALFQLVYPHIEQAQWLAARPPAPDDPQRALIRIDARGAITWASDAATALLSSAAGIAMTDGRIRLSAPALHRRYIQLLKSALAAASEGGSGGTLRIAGDTPGAGLLLSVRPLPGAAALFAPALGAALVELQPYASAPSARALAQWQARLGFTAAEARLAHAFLACGGDLRAAADQCGVRYTTARTHMANLQARAEVRSQAALARLLTQMENG